MHFLFFCCWSDKTYTSAFFLNLVYWKICGRSRIILFCFIIYEIPKETTHRQITRAPTHGFLAIHPVLINNKNQPVDLAITRAETFQIADRPWLLIFFPLSSPPFSRIQYSHSALLNPTRPRQMLTSLLSVSIASFSCSDGTAAVENRRGLIGQHIFPPRIGSVFVFFLFFYSS